MIHAQFEKAVALLESGDVEQLASLLKDHVGLAHARDEGNATLLIRLIDWPGYRPRSAESAKALVDAGVEIDARRDDDNGTALAGALCTKEIDIVEVLVQHGADLTAPLGWTHGTNFELADRICQDLGRQRDDKIKKLAKLISDASGKNVPTRAPFGGTIPLLFVKDVKTATEYYTTQLGFHVDWAQQENGEDCYLGISRGGTEFHLTACACSDDRHTGKLWVRVECDRIDDLFAELDAAGVNITTPPLNQPWGFRELEIEDPDGNRLTFYGPATDDKS